jgi:histidinol-phosphate phosphatase family protein
MGYQKKMAKKRKNVLICIDRDGTLSYDMRYHLGHTNNWKKKVRLLDDVIKGLKKLRKIDCKIYMVTNQTGVAIKDFKLLTLERANEICQFVIDRLKDRGVGIDGYELCGKADVAYTKKRNQYKFHKKLVGNFGCVKPRIGMVKSALKKEGWTLENTKIYFIGDRLTDVQCGINAGGYGILVPFPNRKEEPLKVKKLKGKKKYVAKDFVDACKWISEREL